jgi:hypothetical protein
MKRKGDFKEKTKTSSDTKKPNYGKQMGNKLVSNDKKLYVVLGLLNAYAFFNGLRRSLS